MWQSLGNSWIGAIGGHVVPDDGRLLAEWLTNDIVYTAASRNAMAVASLPWRLYRVLGRGDSGQPVARSQAERVRRKAAAPGAVQQADELEEVTGHPLLDLLAGPSANPEQPGQPGAIGADRLGGWSLWYMTALMLDVFGAAYWHLVPGTLGVPAEIRLLPTQMVQTLRGDRMQVQAYLFTPPVAEKKSVQIEIDAAEVLNFRFPAVEDPWGGRQSPLRSAYGAAQLAVKYNDYQNSLFSNRARIDGTFVPKDVMSTEEAERAEQLWNQKFGRTGNGRVRVSTQPGNFVPTQYPPGDLGELKISQDALKRVCDAFGLPEALLSKDSTYANMSASLHLHAISAIKPRVELIEAELNRRLVPLYGSDLILAADNPVPAEEQLRIQRTQIALSAGIITANEARAALGFDRIEADGADDLPESASAAAAEVTDVGVQAPADFPAPAPAGAPLPESFPADPPTAPPAGAAAGKDLSWLSDINERVGSGKIERSVAISVAALGLGLPEADARRFVGHAPAQKSPASVATVAAPPAMLPGQPELTQVAADFLASQIHDLELALETITHPPAGPAPEALAAKARAQNWWGPFGDWLGRSGLAPDDQATVAAMLLGLFDKQRADLASLLREPEDAVAGAAVESAAKALGVPTESADVISRELYASMLSGAMAAVRRARSAWSAAIVATSLRRVGAALGSIRAEEVGKIASAVVDSAFSDSALRAREIASEELFRSQQIALRAAAELSGRVTKVIWVTADDEKVCPICASLDGHGVDIGEAFESAVGDLDGPPAHVRCRCGLWFVTDTGRILNVTQRGGEDGAASSAPII